MPDLLYLSFDRLASDWAEDAPCAVALELAIEILSPGQSFGAIAAKAADYLAAGVSRVWIADPRDRSVAVFQRDRSPAVYREGDRPTDASFSGLSLAIADIF